MPRTALHCEVAHQGEALHEEAFLFARRRYFEEHGADLRSVAPRLLVALCGETVLGCLGVSCAAEQPLLAERYLDQPLQQAIGERRGSSPERRAIVEIGSLAASTPRVALALLSAAPAALQNGYTLALVTATRKVRKLMRLAGLRALPLARARQDRLPEAQQAGWGAYYAADPFVLLVELDALCAWALTAGGRARAA